MAASEKSRAAARLRSLRQARESAQLLTGDPARSVPELTGRLLAIQAQDARGARLAFRPRTHQLTAADVDAALTDDRSVVVTWLNRGTLHLVLAEDYWWLQQVTTAQLATSNARRLVQEGVNADDAERGVAAIQRALTTHGPLRRDELREHVAAADVPVAGQALVHLLLLASIRGLIVRGPMVRGQQAFVLVPDWLGTPPKSLTRDAALAELARRYLVGHGPATDADLARWAGVTLGDARAGLQELGNDVESFGQLDGGENLLVLRGRGARRADESNADAPPRLLGAFDPLIMGWRDRSVVLPVDGGVVTSNGIFRPVALVAGIGVATWSLAAGRVQLGEPFGDLPAAARAALGPEADDVLGFLGMSGAKK